MINYDEHCFMLAELFVSDSLPLEEKGSPAALKRESHYLAQVIQQAIEDHLADREHDRWRVGDLERDRWGEP